MPIHKCVICCREFKKKNHLDNHNKKKIPCVKSEKQNEFEFIKLELEKYKLENEQLKKEIEQLKNSNECITLNNNINNINNINNNINIVNNFNVIKIIDHGKEDYNRIDLKKIMLKNNILSKFTYISTIIYYIHCNDEYPEYQNIYISDKSRNNAKIYYNGKWSDANKKLTIDNLFNSIVNTLDDVFENSSDIRKFTNYISEINHINPFSNIFSQKDKKQVIHNSEQILYNNRDKIKTIKHVKNKINYPKLL